ADLGSRDVWLHWTPDAPALLDALTPFAPTLLRGLIGEDSAAHAPGWPVIKPWNARADMLILTSDPAAAAIAAQGGATPRPLIGPHLPTLAARQPAGAAADLRRAGCKRFALYGAGKHTRRLARWIVGIPEIVVIADDRAGQPGGPEPRLWGLPVVT